MKPKRQKNKKRINQSINKTSPCVPHKLVTAFKESSPFIKITIIIFRHCMNCICSICSVMFMISFNIFMICDSERTKFCTPSNVFHKEGKHYQWKSKSRFRSSVKCSNQACFVKLWDTPRKIQPLIWPGRTSKLQVTGRSGQLRTLRNWNMFHVKFC